MKKNILIAVLSIACICSVTWNYTQAAKAKATTDPIVTDPDHVGAVMVNESRFGRLTGTFEVILPDPTTVTAQTHTIVLTYDE